VWSFGAAFARSLWSLVCVECHEFLVHVLVHYALVLFARPMAHFVGSPVPTFQGRRFLYPGVYVPARQHQRLLGSASQLAPAPVGAPTAVSGRPMPRDTENANQFSAPYPT